MVIPCWYNLNVYEMPPLIVGFISDLISIVRIESAASKIGYQTQWIEKVDQVALLNPPAPRREPVDGVMGSGEALLDLLSHWHPALILFDLSNGLIPWRDWIALIKSDSATRRYSLLCFGPHTDGEAFRKAREAGADAVVARSRFFSGLPGILAEHARLIDYAALEHTCSQPLSALAIQGFELFNRGEFFEAHEVLEEAWNADQTPGRELYRSVLQVAVAYLQIQRGNYPGAVKMFRRVRQWIDPLPDLCRGVQVERLRQDADRVRRRLLELGPEDIQAFEPDLFQPVLYDAAQ